GQGYRSVWRELTHSDTGGAVTPWSPGLAQARRRVGVAPLAALFARLRGPQAGPETPGAFRAGLRLVSWDVRYVGLGFGRNGGTLRDGHGRPPGRRRATVGKRRTGTRRWSGDVDGEHGCGAGDGGGDAVAVGVDNGEGAGEVTGDCRGGAGEVEGVSAGDGLDA